MTKCIKMLMQISDIMQNQHVHRPSHIPLRIQHVDSLAMMLSLLNVLLIINAIYVRSKQMSITIAL